jgi:hypothetical protein
MGKMRDEWREEDILEEMRDRAKGETMCVDEDGGREIERNYWMRGPRGGGAVLGGEI